MFYEATFFFDRGETVSMYTPSNANALTVAMKDGGRMTIFDLPAPILKAFLDHYGDPNNVGSDPAPSSGVSNPDRDGVVCGRSDLVTVDVS